MPRDRKHHCCHLQSGRFCGTIFFLQTIKDQRLSSTSHELNSGRATRSKMPTCATPLLSLSPQRGRSCATIVFLQTIIRSKEHPPRVTNREAGQATRSELAQLPVAAHHHHLASYSRHHLDSTRSLHHVLFSLISTDNKQNLKTWMNKREWEGFFLSKYFAK